MKSQESLLTKIFIFLFALIVFIFGETLFVHIYASRRDTPYVGTLRELLELACVFCIILAFVFSAKSFFYRGRKKQIWYSTKRNSAFIGCNFPIYPIAFFDICTSRLRAYRLQSLFFYSFFILDFRKCMF